MAAGASGGNRPRSRHCCIRGGREAGMRKTLPTVELTQARSAGLHNIGEAAGPSGPTPAPQLATARDGQSIAAMRRRMKASWVASGSPFGHTSWQPSSVMQPKTPLSSPTSS